VIYFVLFCFCRVEMNNSDESDYLRLTLSPPGQCHSSLFSRDHSVSSPSPDHRGFVDEGCSNFQLVTPASSHNSNEIGGSVVDRSSAPRRGRRGGGTERAGHARPKDDRIVPAYPWATDRRAVVRSLDYLLSHGMMSIRGEVVCKRCDGKETREVDLQSSFLPLSSYFLSNKDTMHDRAPKLWMVPRLLDCNLCHQADCVKPIIDEKKRRINWLFLLLTQTLGLCTLDQLKYFCKHTKKHRTGAKDRVLYLTYVGLLKQLNPSGPYD